MRIQSSFAVGHCLRQDGLGGCLLVAGSAGSVPGDSRPLAFAAFASWLVTEAIGAFMLRSWIVSGGRRQPRDQPETTPAWAVFGHAGLAATGFASWVSFLLTSWAGLAWLAIGLLALAIGLGISTVTLWTPYPARRPGTADPADRAGAEPERLKPKPSDMITDEMLAHALSDEALTSKLVDELLERMLAAPVPAIRHRRLDLAPLVPAAHGLTAVATFLLAMLAATTAG